MPWAICIFITSFTGYKKSSSASIVGCNSNYLQLQLSAQPAVCCNSSLCCWLQLSLCCWLQLQPLSAVVLIKVTFSRLPLFCKQIDDNHTVAKDLQKTICLCEPVGSWIEPAMSGSRSQATFTPEP